MAEDKKTPAAAGDSWVDEFLSSHPAAEEKVSVDETAVFSAGLTHPDDVELEKILDEFRGKPLDPQPEEDDVKPYTPAAQTPPVIPTEPTFKDEEFREAFGEGEALEQVFGEAPVPEEEVQEEEETVEKAAPRRIRPTVSSVCPSWPSRRSGSPSSCSSVYPPAG